MTEKLAERPTQTARLDRPSAAERAERFVPPALRTVPDRVAATGRVPFVLLVVSMLVAGLVAVLLLNVALAQDSYRLHQLKKDTSKLAEQRRSLQEQVAMESAPAALARKAEAQGMVPAGELAYLDLAKDRAYGKPTRAGGKKGDE